MPARFILCATFVCFLSNSSIMGLVDVFNEAAERVKTLPQASNEDQLELYSFFKQAKIGDCNTRKL